jgi:hypothetical protein
MFDLDRQQVRCCTADRISAQQRVLDQSGLIDKDGFDPDVEAWAIFVHDVPHAPSAGARPRGRRLAAAAEPEKLLAALFEEAQLAEVA